MQQKDTVIVFPADTHSGSPVGLMPPGQWAFVNGGYHDPDEAQKMLTRLWEAGWKRVGKAREGKRLIVVHVGDAVEGRHHDSTEVITPRIDEHERIHIAAMERALALAGFNPQAGDLLYYVKGTPAHVGQGGASEERIARQFAGSGVVPRTQPTTAAGGKDGRYLWDRLRLEVNRRLLDIAHHGGTVGLKPWTSTNPLREKLKEIYFRSMARGVRPPDIWVRADRHVKAYDIFVTPSGQAMTGVITPAFQGITEYGYRHNADRPASLGLVWVTISGGGAITPDWELLEVDPDEVQRV